MKVKLEIDWLAREKILDRAILVEVEEAMSLYIRDPGDAHVIHNKCVRNFSRNFQT